MEDERTEASFEALASIQSDLISGEQFEAENVTHAMITSDGTTVPITLNPESGQFMTQDGQIVQVQMAPDETNFPEENEIVLPDHQEQIENQFDPASETIVVKQEVAEPSNISGGLQLIHGEGGQVYVLNSNAISDVGPNIRIVNTSEESSIDDSALQAGKIRIVSNEASSPRKIIRIGQQEPQITINHGGHISAKPKVVIRPAIAPKTEERVQYVRVVNSQPVTQAPERQMVTIRSSGSGLPILPRGASVVSSSSSMGSNVLKIALPSSAANRPQKAQRIILPSEAIRVIDTSGTTRVSSPQIQPKKVISMQQSVPKIEPSPIISSPPESIRSSVDTKPPDIFETTGVKPRKPCNCTKSQCLKLYCECFANGEFCNNCNCNNCFNNLEHEEARQRSIKQCLERNPNAFRPKIGKITNDGERRHNKGCNCKRSGCLKNYCECYEAKIGCTKNCRCIGCKNIEVALGRKPDGDSLTPSAVKEESTSTSLSNSSGMKKSESNLKSRLGAPTVVSGNAFRPVSGVRQPFNFVTQEVVEATCQCLLAQAEEAERNGQPETEIEGLIIEEFGRCLSQIIEMANKQS